MDIVIRAARVADYRDVYAIMRCPGVVRNTSLLPYVSLDIRKDRLENQGTGVHTLVAEIDGRVVGHLRLECGRDRLAHTGGFGLVVHDDFQGQGIGTHLMGAMVDLADNWLNLLRVELGVYTDNEPAIALYKKFGFEIEGTHRAHVFRDGHYADTYTMARIRV